MSVDEPWLSWRTEYGTPFSVGGRRITPLAQVVIVRWPGGGLVWNRPAGIVVEERGATTSIPIHDPTRRWQIIMFAIALVAIWMAYIPRASRKEQAK